MIALWVVLTENGTVVGPFSEPLSAKDWFHRQTSLTEGRYLVMPMSVPVDHDAFVESDAGFLLRLSSMAGKNLSLADLDRLAILGARAKQKEGEQKCPTCSGHGVVGQKPAGGSR